MPLQSRAAQGFAGAAVEVDLIHKGIMTISGCCVPEREASPGGNRPDS